MKEPWIYLHNMVTSSII